MVSIYDNLQTFSTLRYLESLELVYSPS